MEIARWYGEHSPSSKRTDKCLKSKLEDKFNDKGWFTCKTNKTGEYVKICFGKPIDYDEWLRLVKKGVVFFECMKEMLDPIHNGEQTIISGIV